MAATDGGGVGAAAALSQPASDPAGLPNTPEPEPAREPEEQGLSTGGLEDTSDDFTGDGALNFAAVVKDAQQKKKCEGFNWSAKPYESTTKFLHNLDLVAKALGSDTKAGLPVQDPTNSADTLVLQMKGKYGENYMAPPPPKSLLLISLYAACTRSRSLSRLHSHGRLPIP